MIALDGEAKTFESTRDHLVSIEKKLARRFRLRGQIRRSLIEMDRAGRLLEDDLVADWHDAYDSYLNYLHYARGRESSTH